MGCRIVNGPIVRALVVENPAKELDALLEAQGMEVLRLKHIPSETELISILKENRTQVLFKRSKVDVTRRMIEACPDLLAIQLCCIGDDSVDKQACADHGVMVFNDPISNGRSVVELVFASLLSLSRRLFETNLECNEGVWSKNNKDRYELLGKSLGILGLGNIGRAVARLAQSLGMKVHFYDTRLVSIELGKELGWTCHDSIESLFANTDCVTVHVSASDVDGNSNEALLKLEHFRLLGRNRPSGPRIFLNYARGFLHSPEDLLEAVREGVIRKAGVDVYPYEPRTGETWVNPYRDEPNIIVFPHIGASTQEAQPRIAHRVAQTFGQFSKRGAVRDSVFQPRLSLEITDAPKSGQTWLMVCHSTARGTKRCLDEVIFEAGVDNISSIHKDFDEYGMAYDLALLDRPLDEDQVQQLILRAQTLMPKTQVIRSVRQVTL